MLKKVIFVAQGKAVGFSKSLGEVGRLRVRNLSALLIPLVNGSRVMVSAADERLSRATSEIVARELGVDRYSTHRFLNFSGNIPEEEQRTQFLSLLAEREQECEVLVACSPPELVDRFLKLYAKKRGLEVELQGKITTSSARILDLETGKVDTLVT